MTSCSMSCPPAAAAVAGGAAAAEAANPALVAGVIVAAAGVLVAVAEAAYDQGQAADGIWKHKRGLSVGGVSMLLP